MLSKDENVMKFITYLNNESYSYSYNNKNTKYAFN